MEEPAPPPGFLARAAEYQEAATIPRLLVLLHGEGPVTGASRRPVAPAGGRHAHVASATTGPRTTTGARWSAGRHVCRRCLVLYPLALVAAVLASAGVSWPDRVDGWLCWLLPLPAVVEFVGEQLGLLRHRPARLVVDHGPAGRGRAGRSTPVTSTTRATCWSWSIVITYAGICIAVSLWRALRPRR